MLNDEVLRSAGIEPADLEIAESVMNRLVGALGFTVPQAAREVMRSRAGLDRRTRQWRVRLRLYDTDSLVADSDEAADDAPGETVLTGLPAAIEWARDLVKSFQPMADAAGLSVELARRVPSLRVLLARQSGCAKVSLAYDSNGVTYTARLDVTRA